MKRSGAILRAIGLLMLVLAACGGPPEPFDLRPLESADGLFAPPAPDEPRSAADAIREKDELTLENALVLADLMSPELAAERKNVDLAAAAILEAKLYPNPSAIIEAEDYRARDAATTGKMERTAGISVPLVPGGRIGAAVSVAEKEREIAAVNYVWRRREILGDVKKAFLRHLASRENEDLAREVRDVAKAFHDVANERFQAQAVPEAELLKAAVQLAKAESDFGLAEMESSASLKTLHARMGNVDFPAKRCTGELQTRFSMPSLDALRERVETSHPLIEAAVKAKESAELSLALAKAERIPDLGLELTAGRDPEDHGIIEGSLSIPIPLFNRNQARMAAAEVRIRQAELRVQAARNDLLLRLHEAYRDFAAAQDRVTAYAEKILPGARKALDQTNEGYRHGKFGTLDVLDAQRTLAEARTAHAAALADLNLSASELEKLSGMKPESLPKEEP